MGVDIRDFIIGDRNFLESLIIKTGQRRKYVTKKEIPCRCCSVIAIGFVEKIKRIFRAFWH